MGKRTIKWYHGLLALVLFACVMAMQYFGLLGKGIWTSFIGEILFAVIALGVVLIARVKLPEVFRFKRVRILQIVGVYLLWRGVIVIGYWLTEVELYLFPSLASETDGLNEAMRHMPFALALFLIAFVPAICEEMLFRGPILRSLESLRIPWLIIVLDGIIFAAAHLSVLRMLPIGLLGVLLAYLVYSEENMVFSMFIHFVNNTWSVVATYTFFAVNPAQQTAGGSQAQDIPLGVVGITLCACTLSPLLIYIGHQLFRGQKLRKQWMLLCGSLCLLIFSVGLLIFAFGFEEMAALGGLNM